jgi:hypothetical protein
MREIVEKNKPKNSPPPQKKKLHNYFFTVLRLFVDDLGLKSPSFCLNPKPSTLEFAAIGEEEEEENMQWEKGEGAFQFSKLFSDGPFYLWASLKTTHGCKKIPQQCTNSSPLAFVSSNPILTHSSSAIPIIISRNTEQHPQNEFASATQKHRNPRCTNSQKTSKTFALGP